MISDSRLLTGMGSWILLLLHILWNSRALAAFAPTRRRTAGVSIIRENAFDVRNSHNSLEYASSSSIVRSSSPLYILSDNYQEQNYQGDAYYKDEIQRVAFRVASIMSVQTDMDHGDSLICAINCGNNEIRTVAMDLAGRMKAQELAERKVVVVTNLMQENHWGFVSSARMFAALNEQNKVELLSVPLSVPNGEYLYWEGNFEEIISQPDRTLNRNYEGQMVWERVQSSMQANDDGEVFYILPNGRLYRMMTSRGPAKFLTSAQALAVSNEQAFMSGPLPQPMALGEKEPTTYTEPSQPLPEEPPAPVGENNVLPFPPKESPAAKMSNPSKQTLPAPNDLPFPSKNSPVINESSGPSFATPKTADEINDLLFLSKDSPAVNNKPNMSSSTAPFPDAENDGLYFPAKTAPKIDKKLSEPSLVAPTPVADELFPPKDTVPNAMPTAANELPVQKSEKASDTPSTPLLNPLGTTTTPEKSLPSVFSYESAPLNPLGTMTTPEKSSPSVFSTESTESAPLNPLGTTTTPEKSLSSSVFSMERAPLNPLGTTTPEKSSPSAFSAEGAPQPKPAHTDSLPLKNQSIAKRREAPSTTPLNPLESTSGTPKAVSPSTPELADMILDMFKEEEKEEGVAMKPVDCLASPKAAASEISESVKEIVQEDTMVEIKAPVQNMAPPNATIPSMTEIADVVKKILQEDLSESRSPPKLEALGPILARPLPEGAETSSRPVAPSPVEEETVENMTPSTALGFIAGRGPSALPEPWSPPKLETLGPILARPLPEGLKTNARPIVPHLFVEANGEKPKPTLPLGFIAERGPSAVPDPWIPPTLESLGPILARPLPEGIGSSSRPIVPHLFVEANGEKPKPTLPLGFIAKRGPSALPTPWKPPKLDALGPILARPLPEEGLKTSSRPIAPQLFVEDTKESNATTPFGFVSERGPSAPPTPWKPPKLDALGSILARPLPEEGLATSASSRSAVPHLTLAVKTEKAKPTTPFGFVAERGPSVQPSPWEPPKLEALGSIAERRPAKRQTNSSY